MRLLVCISSPTLPKALGKGVWGKTLFTEKVFPHIQSLYLKKLFAFNILADVAGVFDEFLGVVAAVDDEGRGHLDAESLCHIGIDGCVDRDRKSVV